MPGGVVNLKNLQRAHHNAAEELDVGQILQTGRKRFIERGGRGGSPAEVYPVAAPDNSGCLLRRCQLFLIHCTKIHVNRPPKISSFS